MTRVSKLIKEQLNRLRNANCNDSENESSEESSSEKSVESDEDYSQSGTETELEDELFTEDESTNDEDEESLPSLSEIMKFIQEEDERERLESIKLIGKDDSKWKLSGTLGRFNQLNILRLKMGPTTRANLQINEKASSAFKLFMNDSIVQKIIKHTNDKANMIGKDLNLNSDLFNKFIGLVIARVVFASKNCSLDSLWSKKYGINVFKKTMPRDKFRLILRCLRFDDLNTREERIKNGDKFALISEIWNETILNFQQYFNPGQDITIDEQLFGTKARCPFIRYIKSKPKKFGIEFWMAVCKDSKYILNSFPYLGKDESKPENMLFGEHVVRELMKPYLNLGYNVVTDNFFTSKSLGEYLASQKTSLVGTVRANKRFIPPYLKEPMKLYDSRTVYNEIASLTSYQSKPKVRVFVYSSVHKNVTIYNDKKNLPEVIDYYNHSKYGVDMADKMLEATSTKVPSRRWPVHVFYNLLNMIILNSWILYKSVNKLKISRYEYMIKLVEELTTIEREDENEDENNANELPSLKLDKKKRCSIKSNCSGENKTFYLCKKCFKATCGSCSDYICKKCSLN